MDKQEQSISLIEQYIESSASDTVKKKGVALYNANAIKLKEFDSEEDIFKFSVRGTRLFNTNISGVKAGSITTSCSCPFGFGVLCEHTVAALHFIGENIYVQGWFDASGGAPRQDPRTLERTEDGVELIHYKPLLSADLTKMATNNTITKVLRNAYYFECLGVKVTDDTIHFEISEEHQNETVEIKKVNDKVYVSSSKDTKTAHLNSIELFSLRMIAQSDFPHMIAGVFSEENLPYEQNELEQFGLDPNTSFNKFFTYEYDDEKGLCITTSLQSKGLISAAELNNNYLFGFIKTPNKLSALEHLANVNTMFKIGFVVQFGKNTTNKDAVVFKAIRGKTNKASTAIISNVDAYNKYSSSLIPTDNQRKLVELFEEIEAETGGKDQVFNKMQKAFGLLSKEEFIYKTNARDLEIRKNDIAAISVSKESLNLFFELSQDEAFISLKMKFVIGGKEYDHSELDKKQINPFVNSIDEVHYFSKNRRVGECLSSLPSDIKMVINQKDAFYKEVVLPLSKEFEIRFIGGNFETEVIELDFSRKELYLTEKDGHVVFMPQVVYQNDMSVTLYQTGDILDKEDDKITCHKRNLELEDEYIDLLSSLHPKFDDQKTDRLFHLHMTEFTENMWFYKFFDHLKLNNIEVFGLKDLKGFKYSPFQGKITTSVTSSQDWFEVQVDVSFGDNKISLAEIKKAVLRKERYVQLKDGSVGILPKEWFSKLEKYFRNSSINKDDKLEVSKLRFSMVDELFDDIDDVQILQEINEKRDRLKSFTEIQKTEVPQNIKAELRHYQKEGLNWLNFLDEMQWGGILADDMGLGKTLQILTFIQHIVSKEKSTNLIVVPTTLMFNWQKEIAKFASDLNAFYYYGSDRVKDTSDFEQYDLVFTTYGILLRDIQLLSQFKFNYVILDESQAIKNPASRRFKAANLLQAKNRIAMSGTPIENGTFDLYAQMSFVNPGFFSAAQAFKDNYSNPIDRDGDEHVASELQRIVNPFILRRTKEHVATELPSKTEDVIYCEMESKQRAVYDAYRNEYKNRLLNKIDNEGIGKSKMMVLEALMRLRQICDSPVLVNDETVTETQSVKIKEIVRHITNKTTDHKILVFSQFVKMLHLVRAELDLLNIKYTYLDGKSSTKQREESVEIFQNDSSVRVFLISLKAGGTGLNLTAADYVYLLDPWWNPAVENQAIDRCYRIGQDKKVFAYRMICKNTIEEKIVNLQNQKKKIAGDIIQTDENIMKSLTTEDIHDLFS